MGGCQVFAMRLRGAPGARALHTGVDGDGGCLFHPPDAARSRLMHIKLSYGTGQAMASWVSGRTGRGQAASLLWTADAHRTGVPYDLAGKTPAHLPCLPQRCNLPLPPKPRTIVGTLFTR